MKMKGEIQARFIYFTRWLHFVNFGSPVPPFDYISYHSMIICPAGCVLFSLSVSICVCVRMSLSLCVFDCLVGFIMIMGVSPSVCVGLSECLLESVFARIYFF